MVRLRREIEGIHLDRAVPPPAWAVWRRASDDICPHWLEAIRAIDGERLLFCGIPNESIAIAEAQAGKWVTLSDLGPADVRRISTQLDPDVAGRVQLVAKSYGASSFSPSSFDAIIFSDQLHAYDAPEWVLQKVKRELKVDGVLLVRLHVRGAIGDLGPDINAPVGEKPPAWAVTAVNGATPWLGRFVHSSGAPLWLADRGLDAVERRALWQQESTEIVDEKSLLNVQLDAIRSRLHIEDVQIGSTLRAAALAWGAGAQMGPAALALKLARMFPVLADDEDRQRTDARAVIVQARRALISGGKALTFG